MNIRVSMEMTNCSDSPTSLVNVVNVSLFGGGYKSYSGQLKFLSADRKLGPFEQVRLQLDGDIAKSYPMHLFGVITLRFTRGLPKRIYFFNTTKNVVSRWRFWTACVTYYLLNIVPSNSLNL